MTWPILYWCRMMCFVLINMDSTNSKLPTFYFLKDGNSYLPSSFCGCLVPLIVLRNKLKTSDTVSTFFWHFKVTFSNETLPKILWEMTGHLYIAYGLIICLLDDHSSHFICLYFSSFVTIAVGIENNSVFLLKRSGLFFYCENCLGSHGFS